MEPKLKPRRARLRRAATLAMLAIGLAACGDEPPRGETAKPAAQPVDQSAAKTLEAAPAARPQPAPAVTQSAPSAQPCADAALAEQVKSTLDADASLGALAVDVTAAAGEVTLFGTADSDANRAKAAKIAAGVPCVRTVQNKILIVRGS